MKFSFYNPTRLYFGAGQLSRLGEVTRQKGQRALLVTGGGSVKRSGVFERAVASLTDAGISYVECSGIEPNPRLNSVIRGIRMAREENCDIIVALGGGSTMDASKLMAAGFYYEGNPWDLIYEGDKTAAVPTRALPIVTVPTIAATGSETNCGAVISNEETTTKSFISNEILYPYAAIVDPQLTLRVPPDQTAFGVCDLITHVTEGYFNGIDGTPIQDSFAEGVIRTALEWGPKALADGHDLEARTQVQWAATVALNGWLQVGTSAGYPVHMIEHTVSAYHDMTHAAGLAIINPAWMRFAAEFRPEKFARFARNVMGVKEIADDLQCALAGIDQFEAFLKELGCPTRFSDLGISAELFETYARETLRVVTGGQGKLPGRPFLAEEDIVAILQAAQ